MSDPRVDHFDYEGSEPEMILPFACDLVWVERHVIHIGEARMAGLRIRFRPVLQDEPTFQLNLILDPAGMRDAKLCSEEQYEWIMNHVPEGTEPQEGNQP